MYEKKLDGKVIIFLKLNTALIITLKTLRIRRGNVLDDYDLLIAQKLNKLCKEFRFKIFEHFIFHYF